MGKISANNAIMDAITIIEAAAARFLILACNLFTNGFNAAASTNDANNIISNPDSFGIKNNTKTVRVINIIVFKLKNFLIIKVAYRYKFLTMIQKNNIFFNS